MSRTIRLLPEARREFDEAADWYDLRGIGLGKRFIANVRDVFLRIAANPKLHAIVYKNVRKAVVAKFPYIVIYREEVDVVVIVSVFHTSRNPKDWKSRV